jgi:methionyl-tRNA formyltransferase
LVFLGTPEWAVPSLEALHASRLEIHSVVTNPDRPAGRGMNLQAPPVKVAAERLGLPVEQFASARTPDFAEWLSSAEADAAVVVAYGKILPREVLDIPRKGFINLHFSVLPRYRGAAPVQRALIEGEKETGASIMVLTEGMDEGPVLTAHPVEIDPEETAGELGSRLAVIGAGALVEMLPAYLNGEIEGTPQDDARATYAPKVSTDEARIDWTRPASEIHDLVRGLNPAPGAWTELNGRVKVWRTHLAEGVADLAPGELSGSKELLVGTGRGALVLDEVQAAGKKKLSGTEFARGHRLAPHASFG